MRLYFQYDPGAPIRVLLADPYTMSGLGINQVLTEAEDLRFVGHLHTARDFWLVRKLDLPFFDVLLIDAHVVGGVDVLSTLVAALAPPQRRIRERNTGQPWDEL